MWTLYENNKEPIKFYALCFLVGFCISSTFGMFKVWLLRNQATDFISMVIYGTLAFILTQMTYEIYQRDKEKQKHKIH